ncbi:hypothetical protein CF133_06500 [Aeromonas salmonicida]|nr:hypothetical protein CF133_06500 [Aeromonas salmonicida]
MASSIAMTCPSKPFTARQTNTPVAAASVRFAISSPVRTHCVRLRCGLRGCTGIASLVACCFPFLRRRTQRGKSHQATQ